jgi:hypothetical protein
VMALYTAWDTSYSMMHGDRISSDSAQGLATKAAERLTDLCCPHSLYHF